MPQRRALARGEAPIASHLLYPQVLDDADPFQRQQGIAAGLAWAAVADATVRDLAITGESASTIETVAAGGGSLCAFDGD